MRKLGLLIAMLLLSMLCVGQVFADNDLHDEDNLNDADYCAACHRAHTAKQGKLLKVATGTQDQFCYVCHDGTGAETDVKDGELDGSTYGTLGDGLKGGGFENAIMDPDLGGTPVSAAVTSIHSVDNSLQMAWGGGEISGTADYGNLVSLECGDCHNPHGNGNYRILRGNPDGMYNEGTAPAVDVPDEGSPVYTISYKANNYRDTTYVPGEIDNWCAQCHTRYSAGAGQGHIDSGDAVFCYRHNTQSLSGRCLRCHVAHGTTATMGTYSSAVNLPDPTAPYGGADDSRLLFADNRKVCLECHVTGDGQIGGHSGGGDCAACHGASGSHATHTTSNSKGPATPMDCSDCHNAEYTNFADGQPLSSTTVCNTCHSPGGAYNGITSTGDSVGAKTNWASGVYSGNALQSGKEKWCVGCHDATPATIEGTSAPNIGGNNTTYGFYYNGHGRGSVAKECLDCHDTTNTHIDGDAKTYAFDSADYAPGLSGVSYAAGYRLKSVGGDVPLMIPANYNITFSYNAALMRDTAFRLCFDAGCHNSSNVFDDTPGDGINSNFKASLPDPPRNYSYAWGSGADTNEHVSHILNYTGPFADSDWDAGTTGAGGSDGRDTLMACSNCHNVHGVAGIYGSTNEVMIRDGSLAGRAGYGFSYVIEDGAYPQVTSTGATQTSSVGSIFRSNTSDMCGGSMCHGDPAPPAGSSYDATGSSWGTYLEYYRPME